jgi:hypothetical protein
MLSNNPHFCASLGVREKLKTFVSKPLDQGAYKLKRCCSTFYDCGTKRLYGRIYIVAMLYFRRVPPNLHFPWPSTLISHLRCCTTVLNASKWCSLCSVRIHCCELVRSIFVVRRTICIFLGHRPLFLAMQAGWQTATPWCENLSSSEAAVRC